MQFVRIGESAAASTPLDTSHAHDSFLRGQLRISLPQHKHKPDTEQQEGNAAGLGNATWGNP